MARRWGPPPVAMNEPDNVEFLLQAWGPFFRVERRPEGKVLVQVPRHHFFPTVPGGQQIPLKKKPGRLRVAVIGESGAEQLGHSLRGAAAQKSHYDEKMEIVNCGIGAASLEIIGEKFRDALRASPDVVVLQFGHNLQRVYPKVRPRLFNAGLKIQRVRLLSLPADKWAVQRFAETDPEQRREFLIETIARMGRLLEKRGATFVVCVPSSNLWYPPQAYEAEWTDPFYLEALTTYYRGDRRGAATLLKRHLRDRPDSAWWHFVLGEWLYRLGEFAESKEHLRLARDLDPQGTRASSATVAAVRDAAQAAGALLLDVEALTDATAPHGIPGWETFSDQMHTKERIQDREAVRCLTLLQRAGRFSKELDWETLLLKERSTPTFQRELGDMLNRFEPVDRFPSAAMNYWAETWRERFLRLPEEAFLPALNPEQAARLWTAMAQASWVAGDPATAERLNARAYNAGPRRENALFQRALFEIAAGRGARSRRTLEEARERAPSRNDIRYLLDKLRKSI